MELISRCKALFFVTGCAVTLISPEMFFLCTFMLWQIILVSKLWGLSSSIHDNVDQL